MMKNWKTTIIGCIVGGSYAALSALQAGATSPRDYIIAAGFAVLGVVAKDFNITGGNAGSEE